MTETCGKAPVLRVVNLEASVAATGRMLLENIHFEVRPGESLAVIGESGAGKSVMLRAACGLLDEGLTARGCVWLHSTEILHGRCSLVRGRKILYLNQQAMTAFDPLSTIGEQLEQTVRTHFPAWSGSEIEAEIVSTLKRLRFADPRTILSRYPSELSGGMLQRAMLAVVALLKPEVVVADEPTSAVDVPAMRKILGMLCDIRRQTNAALIVATHDLAFAQALAERFVVMKSGRILESGTIEILRHPRHPYLKHLIAMRRRTSASFEEIVSGRERPAVGGEDSACVFLSADGLSKRLCGQLAAVGLAPSLLDRLPRTLSGGELQRVCIARALMTRPKFLVFDEALSSLDACVQGEILQLLSSLVRQATTWLFISHDLRLVATLCTRVLFLHDGKICEDVPVRELGKARSPWAAELVKAASA